MSTAAPRTRARSAPPAPAATSAAPVRSRRALAIAAPVEQVAPVQPVATPEVRTPAAGQLSDEQKATLTAELSAWNESNVEKNRHTRGEKAAAANVEKCLRDWGATTYACTVTFGGKTRTVEAKIGNKVGERLNMTKLRALVTDEVFMKIVSATKDAVTDHAGTSILHQITETVTVPDCFSIKAAK